MLSEHLDSAMPQNSFFFLAVGIPISLLCRSLVVITTSKTKKEVGWWTTFLRIPESAILASVFSFCHMDPLLDTFCLTYPIPFYLQSLNIMLCWVHLNKGLFSSFSCSMTQQQGSQQKTASLTSVDIQAYIYFKTLAMTVNILQIFSKAVTVCEGSLLQNTACNQRTLRGDMVCCKKCYEAILFYLKGKVHSKRKLLSSFTHSCASPKTLDYFSSKNIKDYISKKYPFVHIMSSSQCSS